MLVKMNKRNIYGKPEIICKECGKVAQEAEETIILKMPYCGRCGKKIDDAGQNYCGWCGDKLEWEE